MTLEDKSLLLKDLCARLPYDTVCRVEFKSDGKYESRNMILSGIFKDEAYFTIENGSVYSNDYKPYLFPLSSMTIEQQKEANIFDDMDMDILSENLGRNHRNKTNIPTATYNYIDWLNKNHFDYRGLTERGLAIDATGLNIY